MENSIEKEPKVIEKKCLECGNRNVRPVGTDQIVGSD